MKPRPLLANPGEVWQWEGGKRFYVLRYDHRGKAGQMFVAINIATGAAEDIFMTYDTFNGWQKEM